MDDDMQSTIDRFNDEFMFIWYKGREHIVAREEYRRAFSALLPKYFVPLPKPIAGSSIQTDEPLLYFSLRRDDDCERT
jgi:hypothetical protein